MWVVYVHTCRINEKRYIGVTSQDPIEKRFNYNGSGYKTSTKFWNAIQKYGWNNFDHRIIVSSESKEHIMELEKFYIKLFRTQEDKYGYNILEGGDNAYHYPAEVRKRMSESNKKYKGGMLGKHHSEETKEKIRAAQAGRKMSPERHARHIEAMKKQRGKPGHKMSEENKNKLIEISKRKVLCVETGEVFDSMTECANQFNVLISNLSRAISKGVKYKGYHFEKVCS